MNCGPQLGPHNTKERVMPIIKTPGVNLYYEVHGEGHPVFFVHGGGGNTMCWFQQVPFFQHHYKAITVDMRGFKQSHCAPELIHPRYFPDDDPDPRNSPVQK